MTESMYIHIPFCKSICSYCDFCKMFYNEDLVSKYLDALEREIKSRYKNNSINTLYIGGGSPSALNPLELKKLFKILKTIKLKDNAEITIELNVTDITEEKLEIIKAFGVNRVSIGIETINEKFYKLLNRYNNKKEIIEKINLVKKYFDNFNIDLMYAFKDETISDLMNDLSFVISLNPTHISIYSLIIEEHTKIFIDKILPIDEELEEEMYYNIIKYLKEFGYNHYEISNFSKKGFESAHNLVYWNNMEYYGFGLGASGYIDNMRYTNTRSLNNYIKGNYVLTSDVIDKRLKIENEMMLGLRKTKGIKKEDFFNKYGFNINDYFDIIDLVNNKLLVDDGEYIYIPEDKLYVSNSIIVNFIGGSKNE